MKKSVILLASAILVVSCDLPAGGNKGRLKKTDEVVRYDDPNAPADSTKAVSHVVADSAKTVTSEAKPAATAEAPAEHH